MAFAVSHTSDVRIAAMEGRRPALGTALAGLFHCLLWSICPALVIGNLHADTLELVYWGSQPALGYGKHPPIATWFFDAATAIGFAPIFWILVFSQATVAIAAYFIWRAARLYQNERTAALAVLLYLASPAATFYAVQANHNSVLVPFCSACVFFGLRYLEEGRVRDAVALGIGAGLGLMAKYEILFVLASLVAAAALVPRFRGSFRRPASYLSVLMMFLVASPHIWWLAHNGWPSLDRALGVDKVVSLETLNLSAVNALVGQFTLFVGPALALVCVAPWRREGDAPRRRTGSRLGALIAFAPSLVLFAGAGVTYQVIKPLWVLPLTSCAALGLALMFPADDFGRARPFQIASAAFSLVLLVGYFGYLSIADAIKRPVTAYEPDARMLAQAVGAEWRARRKSPLACIVIAERKLGPSPLLWLHPMPRVVDYSSPFWHTPAQIAHCRKTGAVIVDRAPADRARALFALACLADQRRIAVPARFSLHGATWPMDLAYVPPAGQACPPTRKAGAAPL